jgi:hypothetical protein
MESLAKGNTIFVEVAQRPEEARGGYNKKVFPLRACNEKRKQLKKKSLITLPIYNLNCFSQLAQLLYYLSSQLFRLIAI